MPDQISRVDYYSAIMPNRPGERRACAHLPPQEHIPCTAFPYTWTPAWRARI